MFGNCAVLDRKPLANGQAVNPPPVPAEALDRAPTGDHHQKAANGDGRDKRGRFSKGWKGGPGNPFGRQVALLRREFVVALTPVKIRKLARRLLKLAMGGNVAAAKLVMSYALGQPVQICVTADGLEGGEGLLGEEVGLPSGSIDELLGKVEAEFFSGCQPINADRTLEKRFGPAWADVDRQIDEWQEKDRQRKAARAAKRK